MAKNHQDISEAVVQEARAIAKATQKPGQSKAQTKLIEQGIQKGIAEYKKRQKAKARLLDKQLKQVRKQVKRSDASQLSGHKESFDSSREMGKVKFSPWLPWIMLGVSWLGFAIYWLVMAHV